MLEGGRLLPHVSVSPSARQYLATRWPLATGRHLTIHVAELKVPCCVPFSPPEVRVGAPESPGDYTVAVHGDITIHIPKHLAAHQQALHIVLQGFGPFRSLAVEGWRPFGAADPPE